MLAEILCATVLAAAIPNADIACTYAQDVIEAADSCEVQPLLLVALIQQESNWQVNALGSSGEVGLAQILPRNKQEKRELKIPQRNILTAAQLLSTLELRYKSIDKALQSYNKGRPGFKRGQRYAKAVISKYYKLRKAHRKVMENSNRW